MNKQRGYGHAASQLMESDDPALTFRQFYLAKSRDWDGYTDRTMSEVKAR